jgi:cytochrome c-type biogenesis protein CcmE
MKFLWAIVAFCILVLCAYFGLALYAVNRALHHC